MKLNTESLGSQIVTHEGGRAARITTEQELRRTVMACLLWESSFYESGEAVGDRIKKLVAVTDPEMVAALAIEARSEMNLRHVPLLLCRELARRKALRPDTLATVIQRADELSEFLAIYWKDGREKIAASVKKGLARAFPKFSAYTLAKYNRDGKVKLRDVLFLSHAKPKDEEQATVWKSLIDGTLASPDTWEVALSGGADKKATFERLISEKKLGGLALLRNLRNMLQANVDTGLIRTALLEADVSRVLPFRFIAAARFAPMLEPDLEAALFRSITDKEKLAGETIVLVDVSGSMNQTLSSKSDMDRLDAACGVAMIARELCGALRIFTFSETLVEVGPRRGFALRDAIVSSQLHYATHLAQAIAALPSCARLIVVSDEQAHDNVEGVKANRAYMMNVGTYQNGVGYGGRWTNISGFSEAVVRYIAEIEKESQ